TIKDGHIPLFFQFYLELKNEIDLGDRLPGERIPTIIELHKEYGVSQITVRKALALLQEAGLITKKQRRGIFVCQDLDRVITSHSRSYHDEMKRLETLTRQLISSEWIVPPRRIKLLFEGKPGVFRDGRIFHMQRLWISKKETWRRRLTNVYVPAILYDKIAPDGQTDFVVLEEIGKIKKSLGIPKTITSIETIYPWLCDAQASMFLSLPDGTPIFQRTWKHYAPTGELVWMSESLTTANSIVRKA
ncbi:MAG: GntR family transcriptional regulator, partial [Deltaproteobacteria bacterium]|nr:GntR family transcriptional regulator [Deltaproteobacteria bacterium]